MPTTLLASNLARAAKLVAPHTGNGVLPILANALLTARDGLLYVVATNLDHATIARVGARIGDDWRDICVPPGLLSEWLEAVTSATRPTPPLKDEFKSKPGDGLVSIEVEARTMRLKLACGRTTAHINGIDPDEFPVVKFPEVWPTDSEGNALDVALVGGVEAEVSKADWLFWTPNWDNLTEQWVFVPAVGKRLTFPDIPGHFYCTGKGDGMEFWDQTGATIMDCKGSLSDAHAFLTERLADIPAKRAEIEARHIRPEFAVAGEAPKWAKKLDKAVSKVWAGEADPDFLSVFAGQLADEALDYLTAAFIARNVARDAEATRIQAMEDQINAEESEAKRLKAIEEAAKLDRRTIFNSEHGPEIAYSMAPASYKEEARAKWVEKNADFLNMAREYWVKSERPTEKQLQRKFYRATLGQVKLVARMWNALDQAYRPDHYAEQRRQFEEVVEESSARQDAAIEAAEAEVAEESAVEEPTPEPLRDFPPEVAAQIPALAPCTSAVEFRGPWPWATPLDESARKVMLAAGFRTEIKTGRLYGAPDKTRRLPVVLCHRLPAVTYSPYTR